MKKTMLACAAGLMAMGTMAMSFSYQGVLRNATGGAVADKQPKITFRLYDTATGEAVLWARKYPVSLDDNGLFSIELSDASGSGFDGVTNTLDTVLAEKGQGTLFIGLTVDGSSGEIRPRQKILPTPTAGFAQDVNLARNDFTVSGKTTLVGELVASNATVSGTASIATLSVTGGGTLGGNVKSTGLFTAQGGLSLPASAPIKYGDKDLIPSGTIWMWYGDKNNLPQGWVLCDGNNGTPDLRRRFPVGADDSAPEYRKGTTGGADWVTLTTTQMPIHSHTYYGDDELEPWGASVNARPGGYDATSKQSGDGKLYNTSSVGGNAAHENRPPYCALYFIMKK